MGARHYPRRVCIGSGQGTWHCRNGKNSSYTDMSPANPYTGAVTQAKEFGLITGYEDGTFRPDNTITREEAMVLLNRAMKLTGLNPHVSNANDVIAGFADKVPSTAGRSMPLPLRYKAGLCRALTPSCSHKATLQRRRQRPFCSDF